jgi:tetratricopeptide (TPR) repeat protein
VDIEFSGSADNVVQADQIHGGVHFHQRPRPVPRLLPPAPAHFTGRDRELDELDELLLGEASPPALVVGAGGVGKTALVARWAQRAREQFSDGQLYADLRDNDPDSWNLGENRTIDRFLRALGESPDQFSPASHDLVDLYCSLIAERRVLIVLDNVTSEWQVRQLLADTSRSRFVLISRQEVPGLLTRTGASRLAVRPLPAQDGTTLLSQATSRKQKRSERRALEQLAELCAGLPLALCIAAERLNTRPQLRVADLVEEIRAEPLSAFAVSEATSVRPVFASSYRALEPELARMFRLLGTSTGPDISTAAAAALADVDARTADRVLQALAQLHLVEEHELNRYRMHDLLTAYAAERAEAEGDDRRAAAHRLVTWYLRTAQHADHVLAPHRVASPLPEISGPPAFTGYRHALDWFDTELDNLVAAIDLAISIGADGIAWQIPVVLDTYLDITKHWTHWLVVVNAGFAAAERVGNRSAQALLHIMSGNYQRYWKDDAESTYSYERALALLPDDPRTAGHAWSNLALTHVYLGEHERADEEFAHSLELSTKAGDRVNEAWTLYGMAVSARVRSRFEEAAQLLRRALVIRAELGDRRGEAWALFQLGRVRVEPDVNFQRALELHREVGDRFGQARCLEQLGRLTGSPALFMEALALLEELGHRDAVRIRRKLADPSTHGTADEGRNDPRS